MQEARLGENDWRASGTRLSERSVSGVCVRRCHPRNAAWRKPVAGESRSGCPKEKARRGATAGLRLSSHGTRSSALRRINAAHGIGGRGIGATVDCYLGDSVKTSSRHLLLRYSKSDPRTVTFVPSRIWPASYFSTPLSLARASP